jgi:hypothetical protein
VRFEWGAQKAATNRRKHGVSFEEAASVFLDPLSATGDDPDHSVDERRFVTFGVSSSGRLLSQRAPQLGPIGRFMKKAKKVATGELRPEYQRSDFPALVRGKYLERLRKSSDVVVLETEVANLFPNAAAVNAALRSLVEIARRAGSARRGSR